MHPSKEGFKGAKRPVGAEKSLGWLTESSVQPKRRKDIDGVSASSLIALKSQVAKVQQETTDVREGRLDAEALREQRQRAAGSLSAIFKQKNAGVAERDRTDRLEIKTASDRLADSRAALERKAALYDRLASGAPLEDADAERYEVDFLMKATTGEPQQYAQLAPQAQRPVVDTAEQAAFTRTGGMMTADMAQERQRRAWEQEVGESWRGEAAAEEAADARRQMIADIEGETREGRARAEGARRERQAAEARKRDRLKAEFLRRQLEAARKKQPQKGGKAGGGAESQSLTPKK